MDRVINEEVRRRAGIGRELASRADQRVLRWFVHVKRMDEYHMARRVLMAEVSGARIRRRPSLSWMDGVKMAYGNRGMTAEAAQQRLERVESPGTYVTMSFKLPFLLGTVFFWTTLQCSGGYYIERGGMPLHDAVGIYCKKGATTENQGSGVKYMG